MVARPYPEEEKRMALKWGICSTGKISHDFSSCIKSMPQEEHKIYKERPLRKQGTEITKMTGTYESFVNDEPGFKFIAKLYYMHIPIGGSCLKENADSFAAKFEISKAYDSYEEFAKDGDIEVVYIGAVCTEHVRLSITMLKAGKHVLCEKPGSITAEETRMLNKLAKDLNLFYMQGLWTRCIPTTKRIVEEIKNGSIGDPQVVVGSIAFTVNLEDISLDQMWPKETGGILLETGIYLIQLAVMVYGEMPVSIKSSGEVIENGFDVDGAVIMTFSKEQKACLVYSTKCSGDQNGAKIIGTKGVIEINETLFCPSEVTLPSGKFRIDIPQGFCPFIWRYSSGLRYEADEVRRCIRNGELECPLYTHAESEMVHDIMDEVARQVGRRLKYRPITEC